MLSERTILAIDDTPSIRTFLRVSLTSEGATFLEASTAQEGVRLCREYHPDVVVLDLGLPDRDGLDIISELKQTPGMPVIILSVRKGREVIDSAFKQGADGYVTKPFMVEDLMDKIEEVSAKYKPDGQSN